MCFVLAGSFDCSSNISNSDFSKNAKYSNKKTRVTRIDSAMESETSSLRKSIGSCVNTDCCTISKIWQLYKYRKQKSKHVSCFSQKRLHFWETFTSLDAPFQYYVDDSCRQNYT